MRLPHLCIATIFTLALAASASATNISPWTLEELILRADLVAIVECETAGGNVADYTVIESLKGDPVGSRVRIATTPDYYQGQFEICLCGERFLVTAFRDKNPTRYASWSVAGWVPLWQRRIHAKYTLPLAQGRYLLGAGSQNAAILVQARKLASLKPHEQDLAFVKRLAHRYVADSTDELVSDARALSSRIDHAPSRKAVIAVVHDAVREDSSRADRAAMFLHKIREPAALKHLEGLVRRARGLDRHGRESSIKQIRDYLAIPRQSTRRYRRERATPARIQQFRKALSYLEPHELTIELISELAVADPAALVGHIVRWTNTKAGQSRHLDDGYVLGSLFARACGKDRRGHFRTLLKAADPFIRVAAAVYLAFEDEQEGIVALRPLQKIKGDSGAWAALTLARRGDKQAVARALQLLQEPDIDVTAEPNRTLCAHANFQYQLLVLLSNSAKRSGAPAPPIKRTDNGLRADFKTVAAWWTKHQSRITVKDPWQSVLDPQKTD